MNEYNIADVVMIWDETLNKEVIADILQGSSNDWLYKVQVRRGQENGKEGLVHIECNEFNIKGIRPLSKLERML